MPTPDIDMITPAGRVWLHNVSPEDAATWLAEVMEAVKDAPAIRGGDLMLNTPEEELPMAKWQGTFTLGGVEIKCYVLEDGQRLIDVDDLNAFFAAPLPDDQAALAEEMLAFVRWQRGYS